MPKIDDMIDSLASATFISTLDLSKGYWQIPVHPDSMEKTAFVTTFGKYEFTVMPFGLTGAPAIFQRLMNNICGDLNDNTNAYIDDVVVFSSCWNDHLQHLREVLSRFRREGLTLQPEKCFLAQEEVSFLGHVIGRGLVKPGLAKTAAVADFIIPKTKKDVRAFLGLGTIVNSSRTFQHVPSP